MGNAAAHTGNAEMVMPAVTAERVSARSKPLALEDQFDVDPRMRAGKAKRFGQEDGPRAKRGKALVCEEYNAGRCVQKGRCPNGFIHKCSICGIGGHPATTCTQATDTDQEESTRSRGNGSRDKTMEADAA